jgi:hypothetical protein
MKPSRAGGGRKPSTHYITLQRHMPNDNGTASQRIFPQFSPSLHFTTYCNTMPPKRSLATSIGAPSKRRAIGTAATRRVKTEPGAADIKSQLRDEFINLFKEKYQHGLSNSELKRLFGARYNQLPLIINDLIKESRLSMSKVGNELFYNFIAADLASKFAGLDVSARMVYQIIEKSDNKGIWTKDIR